MKKYYFGLLLTLLTTSAGFADMRAANNALSRGDYATAAKEFQLLAEQGNINAQAHLGYMYYVGEGVKQDYDEALKWYRKAAISGDRDSQYNLATAYSFGEGIPQNYAQAFQWYRRSAEQNHVVAQYSLGIAYAYGEGIQQNMLSAIEWFEKAAQQGYPLAQVSLGRLYQLGENVSQDYSKAAHWYQLAAENGNPNGQYHLSLLYMTGQGVTANMEQALQWLRKAAAQGYAEAQNKLADIEQMGTEKTVLTSPAEAEIADETTLTESANKGGFFARLFGSDQEVSDEDELPAVEATVNQQLDSEQPADIEITEQSESIPSTVSDSVPPDGVTTVLPAIEAEENEPVIAEDKDGFFARLFGSDQEVSDEDELPAVEATVNQQLDSEQLADTEITEQSESIPSTVSDSVPPDGVTVVLPATETEENEPVIAEDKGGFFARLFGSDQEISDEDELPTVETAVNQQLDSEQPVEQTKPAEQAIAYATDIAPLGQEFTVIEENQPSPSDLIADIPMMISKLEDEIIFDKEELIHSLQAVQSLAKQGDASAQLQLGTRYHRGRGIIKDLQLAALWYRRAAEQGNSDAQYYLGNMHLMGEGVAQNDQQAHFWYQRAAKRGHATARKNLDNLLRVFPHTENDMQNYSPPAESRSAEEDYQQGIGYESGEKVAQNYTKALEYFQLSSNKGYAPAQYKLGIAYAHGQGVKKDINLAIGWYTLAAQQGYSAAQRSLCQIYMDTAHGLQNQPLALAWYNILANSGNAMDIHRRDLLKQKLTTAEIAKAETLEQQISK